jgi:hypothetical protein
MRVALLYENHHPRRAHPPVDEAGPRLARAMVDVIFSYTNRNTDVDERSFVPEAALFCRNGRYQSTVKNAAAGGVLQAATTVVGWPLHPASPAGLPSLAIRHFVLLAQQEESFARTSRACGIRPPAAVSD